MIKVIEIYASNDDDLQVKLNDYVGDNRLISVKPNRDDTYQVIYEEN